MNWTKILTNALKTFGHRITQISIILMSIPVIVFSGWLGLLLVMFSNLGVTYLSEVSLDYLGKLFYWNESQVENLWEI